MALNFPNSPTIGDTHTEEGQRWEWNGTAWIINRGPITAAREVTILDVSGGLPVFTTPTAFSTDPVPEGFWDVYVDVIIPWGYGATAGDPAWVHLHLAYQDGSSTFQAVPTPAGYSNSAGQVRFSGGLTISNQIIIPGRSDGTEVLDFLYTFDGFQQTGTANVAPTNLLLTAVAVERFE